MLLSCGRGAEELAVGLLRGDRRAARTAVDTGCRDGCEEPPVEACVAALRCSVAAVVIEHEAVIHGAHHARPHHRELAKIGHRQTTSDFRQRGAVEQQRSDVAVTSWPWRPRHFVPKAAADPHASPQNVDVTSSHHRIAVRASIVVDSALHQGSSERGQSIRVDQPTSCAEYLCRRANAFPGISC